MPNSSVLMVTLVPKFNLPGGAKPEVVSIHHRAFRKHVLPHCTSLSVILKSLSLYVNFDICSFGSRHSFLWEKSCPYSNQSFAEAQKYCDRMKADFGPRSSFLLSNPPLRGASRILIMVLADPEVHLGGSVQVYPAADTRGTRGRSVWVFIGRDVSHSLIDSIVGVGRGFFQVLSDEREGMESKVTRMLRCGLSAHVG